jgi:hypothetical protein
MILYLFREFHVQYYNIRKVSIILKDNICIMRTEKNKRKHISEV